VNEKESDYLCKDWKRCKIFLFEEFFGFSESPKFLLLLKIDLHVKKKLTFDF